MRAVKVWQAIVAGALAGVGAMAIQGLSDDPARLGGQLAGAGFAGGLLFYFLAKLAGWLR